MNIPVSTYRVQLNRDFTFEQLEGLIGYLHGLGISTIYASPVTRASADSTHGYDVTDPHSIHPAIGSAEELRRIAGRLSEKGMSWLQDIVPNHMAFNQENFRLMDVLERGKHSSYYGYFDIDFHHPGFRGKLMIPFLPDDLLVCIQNKEIRFELTPEGIKVAFPGGSYPMSVPGYRLLAQMELRAPSTLPDRFHDWMAAASMPRHYEEWMQRKKNAFGAIVSDPAALGQVEHLLQRVQERDEWLEEILEEQYYSLCNWREVAHTINYRRFFTVSSLICTRMENREVFDEYHTFIHQLYREGLIQGLRIDHIDGLYDPGEYILRLRQLFGKDCYIVAEKILGAKESLPAEWPLEGTSGYDFLSYLDRLFISPEGLREMEACYRKTVPEAKEYAELVVSGKTQILERYMAGELNNLVRLLDELGSKDDERPEALEAALSAWMVHFPLYRIYPEGVPLGDEQARILSESFEKAKVASPECTPALERLQQLFTLSGDDEDKNGRVVSLLKRAMQFTGPLMAKGVEDTAFYTYNALISRNEVGDDPSLSGLDPAHFHDTMKDRLARLPLSMNATATHDTKRGEDARMRLNVLTWMPEEWEKAVGGWFRINEALHVEHEGRTIPAPNEEYYIYQSLLAGIPEDLACSAPFIERLEAAVLKSLREAKVNTSWDAPDKAYEDACLHFVRQILDEGHGFLDAFIPFARKVEEAAFPASLAQTLVKLTAPGIPDIYQGCELWDLSFVDPDNRRSVNYEAAQAHLCKLQELEASNMTSLFLQYMRSNRSTGIEKLYVTWKTLHIRKQFPELFSHGAYHPLEVTGGGNLFLGYARVMDAQWMAVVVSLKPQDVLQKEDVFQKEERRLALPDDAPVTWTNLFTGAAIEAEKGSLSLNELFKAFPVVLLIGAPA